MYKAAFGTVWLLVLVIPLENMLVIPGLGTLGRIVGMATMVTGVAVLVLYRQEIRIHLLHWFMLAFVLLGALSFFWTIDQENTFKRMFTYTQILLMMWLLFQWCDTPEKVRGLYRAFTLGGAVLAAGMIMQFQGARTAARVGAYNFNPNDIASILALTIPLAWYLFLQERKTWLGRLYCLYPLLAGAAIVLTGSRGGMIKALLAGAFVLLNPPRIGRAGGLVLLGLLGAAAWAALDWIPTATWDRLSTVQAEISRGTFGGRTGIWGLGLDVFSQHPFRGVGAGAFSAAVSSFFTQGKSPHNVFLAILVEQGLIGFLAFAAVILTAVVAVLRLTGQERGVWVIMLTIWGASALTCNWEWRKQTWLLLVLAVAHAEAWRQGPSSSRLKPSPASSPPKMAPFFPAAGRP